MDSNMATFKDTAGREWQVAIDAPKIMRIREDCDSKFLLSDGERDNTYERLLADPVLLCRVIFLLCHKEIADRSLSEEEFYLGVIGDAIDAATEAMLKAIISFTPRRTREVLEVCAAKTEKFQQLAVAKALAKINDPTLEARLMEKIDADLTQALDQILTPPASASNTAASSA
jgi:hypothetical protein